MQQGTHKGSVLDVPSGTELFPVLESTQKFTADGVAHSSIPALRSNDEATGCSLPSSSLPTHFSSTAILRVPSRGVIATRVEPPPASSPIPCPTIFQYETKRKEIETFLASPERKSYLLSVDILYTYFSYVEKFTCFRSRFY